MKVVPGGTPAHEGLLRLLAFALDWFVVALWGTLVFGLVMIASGGEPPRLRDPWTGQAIGFVTMTLPVILYFSLCESSPMRASFGKRALGLVVTQETGGRLSFGSALLRNGLKFTPWEFGHTVAQQSIFSSDGGLPPWTIGPAVFAFLGPLWFVTTLFTKRRTPYDRCAASRVARVAEHS